MNIMNKNNKHGKNYGDFVFIYFYSINLYFYFIHFKLIFLNMIVKLFE